MECPHLLDNVKTDGVLVAADSTITKNFSCSECSTKDQNWLCLQCGAVNCGRYVNGHAKLHAEQSGHQVCMSCEVFSVYCYKCDDYVSNDTEADAVNKIRQYVMSINKTDEENGNIDPSENSKDGTESYVSGQNEPSSPSNKDDISVDITPSTASSFSEVSVVLSADNILSKASKSAKTPEEPARSLRPRSRKRSHSEDSSSTENNSSQTKKEKKPSPCNGKTQRDKKIVGLKNLGNTCFMNAVLQSLNNIQEFSCYFSQLPSLEMKTNGRKVYHSRSYTRQSEVEVVMAEELRKVLINLRSGCAKGSGGAISPEYLFHVIWKVVPRFRGYQQQDAHEFLRYMLDRLHTELLQLLPPERESPGARSASIVTAVFGGTLQSEVRCLACGTESKKLDPFLDLSLELPDASRHEEPVPLTDCLQSFVQVEELADTERYFCSSCKCKQKSTKQFRIRRLPNVLCLHLKRFRWHNNYRYMNKVDTSISFPLEALDMSGFVPGDVRDTRRARKASSLYDLAAVIVHHGTGAASGHYTAYAINSDQWFHFNDQTVRPAAADLVASCKPYILFYIRRELTLPPSPSHHPPAT